MVAPTADRSGANLFVLAGILLIAAIAFVAYYPSLSGGFIWDDRLYLTECELIKAPDGLYRFWFTTDPIDYWPVSNSSLWFEWRLWGMNPAGYRVTNLVLHVCVALLIWAVLNKLAIPGAFLAALLFVVHPVNVESVAWIAQRKGLLAMVFLLLSILWYLRADAERRTTDEEREKTASISFYYWLSLAAFLLALLSKGSVALLPIVLLGTVWWVRRTITLADVLAMIPFFAVAAVLTVVNIWFQKQHAGAGIRFAGFDERLAGAGATVWFYLSKALLPIDLVFVYPLWKIHTADALWWLPLCAAVGVHRNIFAEPQPSLEPAPVVRLGNLLLRVGSRDGLHRRLFHEVFAGGRPLPVPRAGGGCGASGRRLEHLASQFARSIARLCHAVGHRHCRRFDCSDDAAIEHLQRCSHRMVDHLAAKSRLLRRPQ